LSCSTKLVTLVNAIAVHSGSVMTSVFFKVIHFNYTNVRKLKQCKIH
jgi:hypothetical protein